MVKELEVIEGDDDKAAEDSRWVYAAVAVVALIIVILFLLFLLRKRAKKYELSPIETITTKPKPAKVLGEPETPTQILEGPIATSTPDTESQPTEELQPDSLSPKSKIIAQEPIQDLIPAMERLPKLPPKQDTEDETEQDDFEEEEEEEDENEKDEVLNEESLENE